MQTAEALERIAYELAEDAARDGVRYLEVRFAPILNVRGGLSLGDALEAPLRGLRRAEEQHGVIGRVIVCALRNMEPEMSRELASLAVAYRNHGVVGFDLAGGERGNPASRHAAAENRSGELSADIDPVADSHQEQKVVRYLRDLVTHSHLHRDENRGHQGEDEHLHMRDVHFHLIRGGAAL